MFHPTLRSKQASARAPSSFRGAHTVPTHPLARCPGPATSCDEVVVDVTMLIEKLSWVLWRVDMMDAQGVGSAGTLDAAGNTGPFDFTVVDKNLDCPGSDAGVRLGCSPTASTTPSAKALLGSTLQRPPL